MSYHMCQFTSSVLTCFLTTSVLAAAPVAAADSPGTNSVHVTRPTHPRHQDDTFSRMFPGLPPFAPQTDESREQAKLLGVKGGTLDAGDNLTDPILSITDPTFSPNNLNNPNMTAGVTFFGQFLDHDLTLALKAPILENTHPRQTTNFRTPGGGFAPVFSI